MTERKVTTIPATQGWRSAAPAVQQKKRRVAAYARVSTDHEEQLTSYDAQISYYTNYIQSHPEWEFVGMYSDEGISGLSTKKREGFNKMVQDALSGRIDLIISKSVSRFARNTVDSLSTIRKLKEHGTEVYFEKENIWTFDSKGELLITIMSSLAQEESRSISENVTWGHRKRMADGKISVPYSVFLGYDKGENGSLVINHEQARIVRFIFAEYIAGLSSYAIAGELTKMGIKTMKGKNVWNKTSVDGILSNEKYKGCALLQKYYTPDFLKKKQAHNNGEVPQYYVENSHPAIIEPEIFDRVQDMIKQRKERGGYSGATIYSSRIKCGVCGNWYGPKVWHSNDAYRRVVWQCNAKFKDKTRCKTPHLTENEIKDAFVRVVNSMITDRQGLTNELCEGLENLTDTAELVKHQQQLAEQMNADSNAIQELIAMNAQVAQDQGQYGLHYDALTAQFQETKAQYDAVTAQITKNGIRSREIERFIHQLEELPDAVAEFSEELWGSLVDHMTVYSKDNIVFTMASGMEIKA